MTEYEEICNGKSIKELEIELDYQINKLGYNAGDSFPAYIFDKINYIKYKNIDELKSTGKGVRQLIEEVSSTYTYSSLSVDKLNKITNEIFNNRIIMDNKIIVQIVNKGDNKLPKYETIGSVGMDVRANIELPNTLISKRNGLLLHPGSRILIPTGLYVAIPIGYEIQVRCRSGLAYKEGIMVVNGIGTIDADYRGEIGVILYNSSDKIVTIHHGDRIAQLVLKESPQLEWEEVDRLINTDRGEGGFGHTGKE